MDQEWAFWVTLIAAVISALFAVSTFVRDILKDKIKIEISNVYVTMDEVDKQVRYNFSINNLSEKPIVITDVKLYKHDKELADNGHKPSHDKFLVGPADIFTGRQRYSELPRIGMDSLNFDSDLVLSPHDSAQLSYYLDEFPNRLDIYTSIPKQSRYPIKVDFEKELDKEIEKLVKTNQ